MYTAYTRNSHKYINTLRELDESGMKIYAASPSLLNTFGDNNTKEPIMNSLENKIFVLDNSSVSSIRRTAYERDSCSLERLTDIDLIIQVFHPIPLFYF